MKKILLNVILVFSAMQVYSSDIIWTTKTNLPTPRYGLAVAVVNNRIFAIGGFNGNTLSTVEEYNSSNDIWITRTAMPTARMGFAIGVVNNKIYAIGGFKQSNYLSIVEEYDVDNDTWVAKANMPTSRYGLAVGVVNDKIYAVAGYNGTAVSTIEEYDPALNTWAVKTSMPTIRAFHSAVVVSSNIYIVGGGSDNNPYSVEVYNPASDTWVTKASMPIGRYDVTACELNNEIYVIGGTHGSDMLSTVEEYDPVANIWTTKTNTAVPRMWAASCVLNNKIYILGGASYPTLVEEGIVYSTFVAHYEVSVPTYGISAGVNFSISITAKNDTGDTLVNYSGNVSLQSVLASNENMAGSGVLGVTNATLASGVATINTQTYNRGESIKIKVTDSNFKVGISSAIEFAPTYNLTMTLAANPSSVLTGEATQLTAEIKDYYGSPLKNATVSFVVVSGSGTLSASNGLTDSYGKITVNFTPLLSGNCEIRAISDGITAVSITVNTLTLVLSGNGGIVVSDDKQSQLEFSANVLPANAYVALSKVSSVSDGEGQEFNITGREKDSGRSIYNLNGSAKMVLHYSVDVNNNVTNTSVKASEAADKLGLFYWDGVYWQKMVGTVDVTAQNVSADVTHFSKYALRPTTKPTAFSYKRVSPKPFTPKAMGIHSRAFFYYENPENLEVNIKIFEGY